MIFPTQYCCVTNWTKLFVFISWSQVCKRNSKCKQHNSFLIVVDVEYYERSRSWCISYTVNQLFSTYIWWVLYCTIHFRHLYIKEGKSVLKWVSKFVLISCNEVKKLWVVSCTDLISLWKSVVILLLWITWTPSLRTIIYRFSQG